MNRNTNFFIDLLRLMPEEASVLVDYYDEVEKKLSHLDAGTGKIPLKKRRELIKVLVCEDVLVDFVHIEIRQGDQVFFNAYDRMMSCWINKPIDLPPRFISRYKLVEQETSWEFESDGFDGLEQWVLVLE